MARISINLLPPEFITEEIKKSKFYKVQVIGVAIILAMAFLTSVTFALRILQSRNVADVQVRLVQAQQKVSDLKSTQAQLVLLKNRLIAINQYLGTPSKQSAMYGLIDSLIPPSILINAISIGKSGEVTLIASIPDSQTLDDLISKLTIKENNQDMVAETSIESLNRTRDGLYRISLKIKPK